MIFIASKSGRKYLVNNIPKSTVAVELLDVLYQRLTTVAESTDSATVDAIMNENTFSTVLRSERYSYMDTLRTTFPHTLLCENNSLTPESTLTSYSVNKGEKIVFCLRNPNNPNEFISTNTIIYVALHEISHIACPEIGHTDMFYDVFKLLLLASMRVGVWEFVDYDVNPVPYCGISIDENLFN